MATTTEAAWHQYRATGDRRLRDRLVQQNDRLALKQAHRMARQCSEPFEDLAQIARIGLIRAVERYNPDHGVAFSSFAVPHIKGEIQHFLRDHWGVVKVARRDFEKAASVERTWGKFKKQNQDVPKPKIAAAMGIDADRWREITESTKRKPIACIDDLPIADNLAADASDSNLDQRLMLEVAKLSQLKRECVIAHYFSNLSPAMIAQQQGVAVEQVQQALDDAIAHLQCQLQDLEAAL